MRDLSTQDAKNTARGRPAFALLLLACFAGLVREGACEDSFFSEEEEDGCQPGYVAVLGDLTPEVFARKKGRPEEGTGKLEGFSQFLEKIAPRGWD